MCDGNSECVMEGESGEQEGGENVWTADADPQNFL